MDIGTEASSGSSSIRGVDLLSCCSEQGDISEEGHFFRIRVTLSLDLVSRVDWLELLVTDAHDTKKFDHVLVGDW